MCFYMYGVSCPLCGEQESWLFGGMSLGCSHQRLVCISLSRSLARSLSQNEERCRSELRCANLAGKPVPSCCRREGQHGGGSTLPMGPGRLCNYRRDSRRPEICSATWLAEAHILRARAVHFVCVLPRSSTVDLGSRFQPCTPALFHRHA